MKNERLTITTRPAELAGDDARLGFGDALRSPCATCPTSPCCRNVPLHTFEVADLVALDHARYLLNFDGIELGIASDGTWNVLYQVPCRHLDLHDFACSVHETPTQPSICTNYNPYACWYRSALGDMTNENHLRVDRRRLDALAGLLGFDDHRAIVSGPSWEEIEVLFDELPIAEPPIEHAVADEPELAEWVEVVLGRAPASSERADLMKDDAEIAAPCTGCGAPCCSTLVFPLAYPTTASSVDYIRFLLGFPGIELGVADGGWGIVVRTRCRHLTDDALCGVYGSEERPLLCRYYDEHACTYKSQFGQPRPDDFLRVRYDHFDWFAECFRFDPDGTIVAAADMASMRSHIEARLRSQHTPERLIGPEPGDASPRAAGHLR